MQKLRNIAIIAHVDHGKTTLVDKMILAGNILRDNAKQTGELILDNNDLERERGITILSKNVSVIYKDYKINIIDTPGHADFGGEVERVLNMCDGVLLLVDAFEGTMPQTRFVLQKALALGKKPIVVINKVDKPNCRPEVVNEQVFDLMFTLDATEEQLDYKTIYGSAKQGWMSHKWNEPTDSLVPLLDAIIDEIPEPAVVEGTPQMLITSLEYSSYTGRIAVGKVTRGSLRAGQNVTLAKRDGATMQKTRIKDLMVFEGLGKKKVNEVPCGEICAILGIEGFEIGDTICDYENPEPLPPIAIDEPTMSMLFTINNSPFFGKDGKYVTSRHIKERLDRELEKNLALRVTPGPSADSFNVFGRGVLHLSVLIETMRREGYELQVGQPRVIVKEIDGRKCEPVEEMTVDCPEECSGTVIELTTKRKGTLKNMTSNGDRVRLEFDIPSRGIIGLRSNMLTATAGEGGAITPSGRVAVANGGSQTFTVTADSGYSISDVTVDDSTAAAVVQNDNGTYTVQNVTKDCTIHATFSKSSSSGGSSSGKTTYKVTTSAVNNGGVNASPSSAEKGATITITLSPDKGYKLDKLTVTDGSGKTVSTVKKSDTVYTFTMPASAVKVGVSYVKATETPSETKFNDVSANDWFASAVDYVTGKGMMNGTADNTFSPKANTTRGMVVTVLYRLENQPSTSAASFTDVASGAYYANALAWANANGNVSGYGSGKFGPNDKVTREQLAAILYRYAQYKKYDVSVGEDTNILSYDAAQSISSYELPAKQWECGAGVVTGKSGSKLDPKGNATRAEVAAMLMRFCENVK